MIVVLDSSIWISALQFGGVPMRVAQSSFLHHRTAICDGLLAEVTRVLASKFRWRPARIQREMNSLLTKAIREQNSYELHGVCRDPKDDMVLECAVMVNAQVIVSGDKDLLSLSSFQGIPIVTAAEFIVMTES